MTTLTKTKKQKFKEGEIVFLKPKHSQVKNYLGEIEKISDKKVKLFIFSDEEKETDLKNIEEITPKMKDFLNETSLDSENTHKFIEIFNNLEEGNFPEEGAEIKIDLLDQAINFSSRFKKGYIRNHYNKPTNYITVFSSNYNWAAKLQAIDKKTNILHELRIYSSEYSPTFIDEATQTKIQHLKCPNCGSQDFEKTEIKDTSINTVNQFNDNQFQTGDTMKTLTCHECNLVYTENEIEKLKA